MENRIQSHYITKRVSNEDVQSQIFVGKDIAKATRKGWIGRTFIDQMRAVVSFLKVNVAGSQLSLLIDESRYTLLVQPLEIHGEKPSYRVAFYGKSLSGDKIHNGRTAFKVCHRILGLGEN